MTSDKTLIWTTSVLAFLFALSLALYTLLPGSLTRTVLAFPAEIGGQLKYEKRGLPFNGDREHDAALLVKEILLGPARHSHLRLFSRDASLQSVLVRGPIVYIDLSKQTFQPDPDVVYSPGKALDVLRATLMDNVPGVTSVKISVAGEPVRANIVDKG